MMRQRGLAASAAASSAGGSHLHLGGEPSACSLAVQECQRESLTDFASLLIDYFVHMLNGRPTQPLFPE